MEEVHGLKTFDPILMVSTIVECLTFHRVHFDELKVPVPDDVPTLHSIFDTVMNAHRNPQHYSFAADGLAAFKIVRDSLVDVKAKTTDEDVQGILAKAQGCVARTVMILHSLEQAVTG